MKEIDTEAVAYHIRGLLEALGDDPDREGLKETPQRVARMYEEVFEGMRYTNEEIAQMFDKTFEEDLTFSSENSDFVIVKDIDFFSLCEHHMLPFFGKAHVAYIPKKYITGLSKIPRVVDIFARRLQIQERLTMQIKDCIQETLDPLGVMVVIEAQHMCMQMRGVEKQNSLTTTSDFTGFFQQAKTREEFMNLIKHNR